MLDQYRTYLAHQDDNPQNYFSRELTRIVTGNHPLFAPLEADDMDKVSIEKAYAFLNQCINPGDYTFIFTGNFNVDLMKEYSANYIASIPNAASMNQWIDPGVIRPQAIERSIYRGQDERSMAYLAWYTGGPSVFNEKDSMTAAILSEYLDILLTDEIREKLSGVYSISSGASTSTIPKGENSLYVFFQCDPARVTELIGAVKDRLTDIVNLPLNMDTFNKSKEALLMDYENSIQRNLYIAQSYANSSVSLNTPLNRLNTRPDVIRSVSPDDVRALCRSMLSSGPVQVVMYPQGRY
jgi:zinc protease